METYEYDYNAAKDYMTKTDKRRANYYNYYSNKKWGAASTYDLCLNRTKLGFDGCVEAIVDYIRLRERQKKEDTSSAAGTDKDASASPESNRVAVCIVK